ncbi:hypothetical protein KIL84_008313 [Mauremys mutica]|uniref:Uncharacterized protein n=1 Tax=Mauremys mutica TaxID=74926 RepID=A0A9D4AZF1_9SAUR|nr:hypothetical protein KIL84_008313 [Mauremys mutica]
MAFVSVCLSQDARRAELFCSWNLEGAVGNASLRYHIGLSGCIPCSGRALHAEALEMNSPVFSVGLRAGGEA